LSKDLDGLAESNAFISLEGEEHAITYGELWDQVNLQARGIASALAGDGPVLLLFDRSVGFVITFLACQMAGRTSIPMFFPRTARHFERLYAILEDAGATSVLCEEGHADRIYSKLINHGFAGQVVAATDLATQTEVSLPGMAPNATAFLQYTSGSTGKPKGVKVSQENLWHNQTLLQQTFATTSDSVIVTWLPFYHDMGLIGNLMHSLYLGATCVVLSPAEVIQKPLRWLEAIEKYGGTHSGGPNFIYDHCVKAIPVDAASGLDLRTWQVAYNGSEPVQAATLQAFASHFASAGFRPEALHTCYGLAEHTLIVSGGKPTHDVAIGISSGAICPGVSVAFYEAATQTFHKKMGEICLASPSVTEGYWGQNAEEDFVTQDGVRYLRTGDLGQQVGDQLYITGRLKEMVIIQGKNFYPYDLERALADQVDEISLNGVVFTYVEDAGEQPLVVAEISRQVLASEAYLPIVQQIEAYLVAELGLPPYDVLFVKPRHLPRTSSGKLQRVKVRQGYLEGTLDFVYQHRDSISGETTIAHHLTAFLDDPQAEHLEAYLLALLADTLRLKRDELDAFGDINLYELGISSLTGVALVNRINQDLELNLEATHLLETGTLPAVRDRILTLQWLNASTNDGEEIVL